MLKRIKKGAFTLIELMAVIVILGFLSLILVPAIQNIISSAKKNAFKSSVYGIMDSASNYIGSQIMTNLGDVMPTEFTCDGTSCSDQKYNLEFNGTVPIGGTITVNSEEDIYVTFLTDGHYCASGSKGNLEIADNCNYLDHTNPVVYAYDSESNISKYRLDLYKSDALIASTDIAYVDSKISYEFIKLTSNTEYKIGVVAINGNNMEEVRYNLVSTSNISNPQITYTNDPASPINNYLQSQESTINYIDSNITNPTHYLKSTRIGTSNVDIISSCGTGNTPGECNDINPITSLAIDTWYKVSSNVAISYSSNDSSSGVLYAITYDGTNYNDSTTAIISKIDSIAPIVSVNVSDTTATINMVDSGSGINSYCIATTNTSVGCVWLGNTTGSATYSSTDSGTYYVYAKDNIGNISSVTPFKIDHTYALNQTWTYTAKGYVEAFTAPDSGIYKLEVVGAGGVGSGNNGGISTGYVKLIKNQSIYIAVGSNSGWTGGGYNGGAAGVSGNDDGEVWVGYGGGGATSITTTHQGILANFATYTQEVLIVAGGGGGAVNNGRGGGGGGGLEGVSIGLCTCGVGQGGGTQTGGGGSFGYGSSINGGGGGGGWYGGRGGLRGSPGWGTPTHCVSGGSGGSGYIGGVATFTYNGVTYAPTTSTQYTSGPYAKITLVAYYTAPTETEVGASWEYAYTGTVQSFTAKQSGVYKLDVIGATGFIKLNKDQTIYIAVGGNSGGSGGGYNGGAAGGSGSDDGETWIGGGGGGATSITTTNRGVLANYASYKSEILIVAGGGGGATHDRDTSTNTYRGGGSGGGLEGVSMGFCTCGVGQGAGTQSIAGDGASFGSGGTQTGGGGGGGLYGGRGGLRGSPGWGTPSHCVSGGSGGSGYIDGVPSFTYNDVTYSSVTTTQNMYSAYAKITLVAL